jgi:transposase
MDLTSPPPVRKRQLYSRDFKSQVIAEARQPHVSIASVALSHGLNANLLRNWIKNADPTYIGKHRPDLQSINDRVSLGSSPAFLPVNFPSAQPTPKSVGQCIEVEVQKGNTTVKVKWPLQASHSCLIWLREIAQ